LHHIHPAFVVISAAQAVFGFLVMGFLSLMSGTFYTSFEYGLFAGMGILLGLGLLFVVLIGLSVLIAYIYYKRFLWEITEADIHIYSGIIFKKQVHIPFQRVQSIDFNAPIVERILGLVKLKIETAGGASNRGVIIPALKLNEAEVLRAEVFARRRAFAWQQEVALQSRVEAARTTQTVSVAGVAQTDFPFEARIGQMPAVSASAPGEFTAADTWVHDIGNRAGELRGIYAEEFNEDVPIEYEYGLTAKELFLAAISGDQHLVFLLTLIGLGSQALGFLGSLNLDGAAEVVLRYAFDSAALPFTLFLGVLLFVFSILMGIIAAAISYGGFKARRRGGRIEVERGLLARQYRGVSVTRVQSIEIRQGFIRRLMGYAELKLLTIDSAGTSANQQNAQALQTSGLVIHPFIKVDKVADILKGIAPEFESRPVEAEFKPLPKVALRRSIIRFGVFPGLLYAVCVLVVTLCLLFIPLDSLSLVPALPLALGSLALALFILHLIGAVLWYRHAAFAYNRNMLVLRQGGYSQTTTIIPRHKIQWAATLQNPWQRLARVATISVTTAAGIGGTQTRLRDLGFDDAAAYFEWVRPRPRQSLLNKTCH
jgi:putative membrane protein